MEAFDFTCKNCGEHDLIVIRNAIIPCVVTKITEENGKAVVGWRDEDLGLDFLDINSFICANCDQELDGVYDDASLVKYIKSNLLVARAKAHIKKLKDDVDYWGSDSDLSEELCITNEAEKILSKDDINNWKRYCARATSEEIFQWLVNKLL